MDYTVPTLAQGDTYAAVLAAILDYSAVLDRVGGDMGVGLNAALSSALTLMIANYYSKHHKGASGSKIYAPVKGAIFSGILATVMVRILGNNIQNPNLLGAVGTLVGTYYAAEKGL
jgi:hypothetical protein